MGLGLWGILIASVYQSQVLFDGCELVVRLVSFGFTISPGICELLQLVGVILLLFVLIFGSDMVWWQTQ